MLSGYNSFTLTLVTTATEAQLRLVLTIQNHTQSETRVYTSRHHLIGRYVRIRFSPHHNEHLQLCEVQVQGKYHYHPRTKYGGRYCFHSCLSVHILGGVDRGGGYPLSRSGREGYHISDQDKGYPVPGQDGGTPCQDWIGYHPSGLDGVPPPSELDGVPPNWDWMGVLSRRKIGS